MGYARVDDQEQVESRKTDRKKCVLLWLDTRAWLSPGKAAEQCKDESKGTDSAR